VEKKKHAAGNRFKFCVKKKNMQRATASNFAWRKKHAAGNRLTNFSEQPLERNA